MLDKHLFLYSNIVYRLYHQCYCIHICDTFFNNSDHVIAQACLSFMKTGSIK